MAPSMRLDPETFSASSEHHVSQMSVSAVT